MQSPIGARPGETVKTITGDYLRSLFDSDGVKDRLDLCADLSRRYGQPVAFEVLQPRFDSDDVYFCPSVTPTSALREFTAYAARFPEDAALVMGCLTEGSDKPPGLSIAILAAHRENRQTPVVAWITRRENRESTLLDTRPIQGQYVPEDEKIYLVQQTVGTPFKEPPRDIRRRPEFGSELRKNIHNGVIGYRDRAFTDLQVLDEFAFDCVRIENPGEN